MTLFSQKKRFAAARAFSSVALTVLASASLLAPAHAWSYTTTSLGIGASDINDNDFVVGGGPTSPPSSYSKMWTWDPVNGAVDQGLALLPPLTPMPGAGATAVTNTSPVRIGGNGWAAGPDNFQGTYWTPTVAPAPPFSPTRVNPYIASTGYASHVFGVDDTEGIAGDVKLNIPLYSPPSQACWWLATTANPNPSPNLITTYGSSSAYDITGYGSGLHNVVGWGSIIASPPTSRAFVAVVNNAGTSPVVTELFPLDTTIQSHARAINSNGTIVGTRNGHAFVFVPFTAHGTTGTITYLSETPSGGATGTGSYAWEINDNGTIVGYYLDSLGVQKAARWDAPYSGNVIDLNAVASLGTNNFARAINNSGNIVVGGPTFYNSQLLTYHP